MFVILAMIMEIILIVTILAGTTPSTPLTIMFIGMLAILSIDIAADRIAAAIREAKRDD